MTPKAPSISKFYFSKDRPLESLWRPQLLEMIDESLSSETPDIEQATFAYDELRYRGKEDKAEIIFTDYGIKPIGWLQSARSQLQRLKPPPKKGFQGHLYTILIDGYTEHSGFYGAYVGVSKYTPKVRFKQHKSDQNSSSRVRDRGIQLLRSLCWPFRTIPGGRPEREYWETSLHKALEAAVPKVSGDVVPIEEIPETFENWAICAETN